jgi:hypothetical protein
MNSLEVPQTTEETDDTGPCPRLGNHLRALKCETIQKLLGKLSGGLTPDARMLSLRVVISNRPAHQLA